MKVRIQKWGHSLAVRIPKSLALKAGLKADGMVEIALVEGHLIITPMNSPQLTLKHLLNQITDENLHHEIDTESATGNEAW